MTQSLLDQSKIDAIKQELKWHPGGVTISALSYKMMMNRNLLAKYLDLLLRSGDVSVTIAGTSKVYSLSRRVPVNQLLNFVSDSVIVLDSDLKIVSLNKNLLERLGEKRDSLIGKKLNASGNSFLEGLDVSRFRNNDSSFTDLVIDITGLINNTTCSFRIKSVPVVFDDGNKGLALILKDITHQIQPRPLQEISGAGYQGIVEDQTEFIIRFLPDGTLTFVNNSFCHYLKMDVHEILGRSFFSRLFEEDREQVQMSLRGLNRENPARSVELRVKGPAGVPRWHRWTNFAHSLDDKGNIREYLGVGRDISDTCQIEKKFNLFISDQEFLYWHAWEFANLPADADIYLAIGKGIKELIPDAIVSVNTFDSFVPAEITYSTFRCFLGEKERQVFSQFIGRDIVGWGLGSPNESARSHILPCLMTGKLVKIPGNLHVVMMWSIPQSDCDKIEKILNLGDTYVIGLVSRSMLFGNIVIHLKKGDVLDRPMLIETYASQAMLALKCRHAEQELMEQSKIQHYKIPLSEREREFNIDSEKDGGTVSKNSS
ncbi:PAS domain-containing protein [Methanoregula sp.]|uniref:PAS domain-containing protein n=1 Tax=Methanoregula sp. TaxID=2052170 RepID=UPI003BAE25A9